MRDPKTLPAYTIVQFRSGELGYIMPNSGGKVMVVPSDDAKALYVSVPDRVMPLLSPEQALENYIHIMHGPTSY